MPDTNNPIKKFKLSHVLIWIMLSMLICGTLSALFEKQAKPQKAPATPPIDLVETFSAPADTAIENTVTLQTIPAEIVTPAQEISPLITSPVIPPIVQPVSESRKIDYEIFSEDATRIQSARAVNITAAVTYKVNEKAKIGVEASQEIHDLKDAKAWGKEHEDVQEARIKYNLAF